MDSVIPGYSTMPVTSSPTSPDIMDPLTGQAIKSYDDLRNAVNRDPFTGNRVATFDEVRSTLGQTSGSYETILQNLARLNETQKKSNTSAAQALAVRRGQAGSSTEQFGVANAARQSDEALLGSQSEVLLQKAAQEARAREVLANLTSDEIASLRNQGFSNRYLDLQQSLGQQGLDIERQNIAAQEQLAREQQRNQLISSAMQGALPFLMPKLFPGASGAGVPGTGGSGALTFLGAGNNLTGAALPGGGGAPSSSLFPGGVGAQGVGTGVPATGMIPAGFTRLLGGAGGGMLAGQLAQATLFSPTQRGDAQFSQYGSALGGIAGSMFGPAGTFVGGFLGAGVGKASSRLYQGVQKSLGKSATNTIEAIVAPFANPKKTINTVSKSVKKIFPF